MRAQLHLRTEVFFASIVNTFVKNVQTFAAYFRPVPSGTRCPLQHVSGTAKSKNHRSVRNGAEFDVDSQLFAC